MQTRTLNKKIVDYRYIYRSEMDMDVKKSRFVKRIIVAQNRLSFF